MTTHDEEEDDDDEDPEDARGADVAWKIFLLLFGAVRCRCVPVLFLLLAALIGPEVGS